MMKTGRGNLPPQSHLTKYLIDSNNGSMTRLGANTQGKDFNASQIAIKPRIKSIQVTSFHSYACVSIDLDIRLQP